MDPAGRARGLVSLPAGNHAAALAYAATAVGAKATVVMPASADLAVMAGQGTVGLEFPGQVPSVGVVVVPVGGGGLISGIAAAVKLQHPSVRMVGVEPDGADAMSRSLELGGARPSGKGRHHSRRPGPPVRRRAHLPARPELRGRSGAGDGWGDRRRGSRADPAAEACR